MQRHRRLRHDIEDSHTSDTSSDEETSSEDLHFTVQEPAPALDQLEDSMIDSASEPDEPDVQLDSIIPMIPLDPVQSDLDGEGSGAIDSSHEGSDIDAREELPQDDIVQMESDTPAPESSSSDNEGPLAPPTSRPRRQRRLPAHLRSGDYV